MIMDVYAYTFLSVFLINLIPIFGPPTWMVLSFVSFTYHVPSLSILVLGAVCASTLGRFCMMSFSKSIIRNRWLGERYKKNMVRLEHYLENKSHIVSAVFLADAITPLPSDQLFVAYGLTGLKARYALIPFFIGRIVTYSFWVYTANEAAQIFAVSSVTSYSFLSASFLFVGIFSSLFIYFFIKIDWKYFISNHSFRLI